MKFNGAIFSKPQQDQLKENIGNEVEKVSAKIDEIGAKNHDIALNEIANYHPTIVPDAVFIANLDNQDVVLRIENVTSNGHEYTLSSAFQFANYGTNAVFVYSLIIDTEKNTKKGYKASISGSDVTITSVTVPSTIKVCYNGKN